MKLSWVYFACLLLVVSTASCTSTTVKSMETAQPAPARDLKTTHQQIAVLPDRKVPSAPRRLAESRLQRAYPAPLATMGSGGGYAHSYIPPPAYFEPAPNTEEYAHHVDSDYKDVRSAPLSTFSADVDTASYSNCRRMLTGGEVPPQDAVNVEEFVNYFSYSYSEPQGGDPVSITTEVAQCPWQPQHRLVRIGLKARSIDRETLPPSNLVFLLDTSGSMGTPERLPLIQKACHLLVDQMRPIDKVAIVTYAGEAGLQLPFTSGDRRDAIREVVDRLHAEGSTAGSEGIKLAYSIGRQSFDPQANNRVILATDGDFNVGVTSDDDLEKLIESEKRDGIFLSVLGVGEGNLKNKKMQMLADKGSGNYSYIDNIQEAEKVLVAEMGATLVTVAKDVKLQVEFNPALVQSYRLVGYEKRALEAEDFNNDQKDAGVMGAGHTVTALYEVVPAGSAPAAVDPLKYQQADGKRPELLTVKVRYKLPAEDTSRLLEHPVADRAAAPERASDDFRFAAGVAEFAMLLRDSPYKGSASFRDAALLAKGALATDPGGSRAEFIRLADTRATLEVSAR